ncbi:MAG TPA: NDP-sugar synthase [Methanomassiliicoccales archaeon]|nr:NDP-sugar synthase [Methanomassiliicoccales archaeon]
MKAVILAGGLGTRLRPLTYTIPKSLVPVAGKPLVTRIIDSLPASVDTVVLAVSYMRDALEDYFVTNPPGRKVVLVNETSPLGTGGALKNVREHLDESFIALNGDCLSSLDLKQMVRAHRENGGIGTVALWKVDDPSAFGVVEMDASNRIFSFQEKPKREEARSNLINAGVYVFEPEILDFIGKGVVSLEREVFPRVLEYGLLGHRFEGYWVDCGTRESLLKAQGIMLAHEGHKVSGCTVDPSASISPPDLLRGCKVGSCNLGPNVVAEEGVQVLDGAAVSNALLMRGAIIGKGAVVRDSIIGPGKQLVEGEKAVEVVLAERY